MYYKLYIRKTPISTNRRRTGNGKRRRVQVFSRTKLLSSKDQLKKKNWSDHLSRTLSKCGTWIEFWTALISDPLYISTIFLNFYNKIEYKLAFYEQKKPENRFFEFMIPTIMFKAIYGIFACFSRLTSF